MAVQAGPNLRLDKAYLIAIWLETLFYGMNLLLFIFYLFVAIYKRQTPRLNKLLFCTAIAMFCFSTVHVSLGFYCLIEGFIYRHGQPGGPSAFFADVSNPANVVKIITHTINSILGDSIVVWRCYYIWEKSWRICVFPIILIIASAACGFGQGIGFAQAKDTNGVFGSNLASWNGSLFSLSLATNVTVTSLIAFRIWYLVRRIRSQYNSASFYRMVLVLIVESGAIYSSALVFEIVFYFLNSNIFYIMYNPIAQLTAIVPTMIIVMTSLGFTCQVVNSRKSGTPMLSYNTRSQPLSAFGTPPGESTDHGATDSVHMDVVVNAPSFSGPNHKI